MGRINWLAAELRAAGLTVVEVAGSRTRGSDTFDPIGVTQHHTAAGGTAATPSMNVVTHGRAGISGPLCNLLIGRDRKVYVIATGRANHAGKGGPYGRIPRDMANRYTVGIEVEHAGTSKEAWDPDQVEVAERAAAVIVNKLGASTSYVIGHKEWTSRKIDPYRWDMAAHRANVDRWRKSGGRKARVVVTTVAVALAALATVLGVSVTDLERANPGLDPDRPVAPSVTVTLPPNAPVPTPNPTITTPTSPPPPRPAPSAGGGLRYSAAVADQQRALNRVGARLTVDGLRGPATIAAIRTVQRRCGIAVDGIYGPQTTACVNRLAAAGTRASSSLVRRGDRGPAVGVLQRDLRAAGYRVSVDNIAGPQTIGALRSAQARCGITRDGIYGPASTRCLDRLATGTTSVAVVRGIVQYGDRGAEVRTVQAAVGARVDGIYGRATKRLVERAQARAGVRVDGIVGPVTARALGLPYAR